MARHAITNQFSFSRSEIPNLELVKNKKKASRRLVVAEAATPCITTKITLEVDNEDPR